MSGNKSFPYQANIEQIKKQLWCGREHGKASLMVGTGFSRNAEKVFDDAKPFPCWKELKDKMAEELYINDPSKKENAKLKKGQELASEYEAVFGRVALDNFICNAIPDKHYKPGPLHEILLSLPWADVFTTNYDTLLEGSRERIYHKKYDIVYNISDISCSMMPRIVKLHGSLPSNKPFIITEEDYRTYHTQYAPFVNMVQQTMMENVLCLIGFAGDDPNFKIWTGWIRDNLGENQPPIYLCGVLELSQSERIVFEKNKIFPIDLAMMFPKNDDIDEDIRHRRALEWFLKELQSGEPVSPLSWPRSLSDFSHSPPFVKGAGGI